MTVGDMKRKVVHYLHHSPSLSAAGRRDVSGVNRGVVDVPAQPGGGGRQGGNTLSLDLIADRISADQDLNHCKVSKSDIKISLWKCYDLCVETTPRIFGPDLGKSKIILIVKYFSL